MPTTRSSGRLLVSASQASTRADADSTTKRKASTSPKKTGIKKSRSNDSRATEAIRAANSLPPSRANSNAELALQKVSVALPAVLPFSFQEAKEHLISADDRFQDLFDRLACKPFEHLEQNVSHALHDTTFSALATSILGQQISWLAARSIIHKFKRLYDSSMPESWKDLPSAAYSSSAFFPTPEQVAGTEVATLRTAGLSLRKAEYVKDLAARFADGRLSTEKLVEANDEELTEMLTAVRGIGKWTVDMFAIFSLRRPDILPVGDLGVQRGLLRWVLSLHSPSYSYSISPNKIDQDQEKAKDEDSPLFSKPPPQTPQSSQRVEERAVTPDISSVPPASGDDGVVGGIPAMPPPFTPSINRTLHKAPKLSQTSGIPRLPDGLSAATLKSRLDGKKVKGAFLTPWEMESLTESWKPYRSVGVYYMWSLADPTK